MYCLDACSGVVQEKEEVLGSVRDILTRCVTASLMTPVQSRVHNQ